MILACDLVRANGWWELRPTDQRVIELSALLQLPWLHPLEIRPPRFRSVNSVSRKTSDIFTRLPHYAGAQTRGGRLDSVVLAEFLADPAGMASRAGALRQQIAAGEPVTPVETGAVTAQTPSRTPTPTPPLPEPPTIPAGSHAMSQAEAVLASPAFAAQHARAGRHACRLDLVHQTLALLLHLEGRTSRQMVAAATGLQPETIPSTIAAMRRSLNIDGYEVLAIDRDGQTVRLDARLLRDQFRLS